MGGNVHEENLRRARQQDGVERACPRRQAALQKRLEHAVDLTFSPQGCADDGPGERAVPWRQVEHDAVPDASQHVVERLPLLQDGVEHFGRRPPRGQADLMIARARQGFVLRGVCGHVVVSKVLRVLKSETGI